MTLPTSRRYTGRKYDATFRNFYSDFISLHIRITSFTSGIADNVADSENKTKQHFISLFLKRIIFCQFIQSHGFLNNDTDYLLHSFEKFSARKDDNIHSSDQDSFYREFLLPFFNEGLDSEERQEGFADKFGHIPFIGGGIFSDHYLEKEFPQANIADGALPDLFNFLSRWEWRLDAEYTKTRKVITPEIIDYIFEKHANFKSEAGIYYTDDDIAEYIAEYTIIPIILERVRESLPNYFSTKGEIGNLLCKNAQRYIHKSCLKGYTSDWRCRLPNEITKGIITPDMYAVYAETPMDSPSALSSLRKHWNKPTPESLAIPKETWRETIARFEHCDMVINRMEAGEIKDVDDLITLNLNLQGLTFDILHSTGDYKLIRTFYATLKGITVVDPTCGSGAFLMAAVNVLHPLYLECLRRMKEFNTSNSRLFANEISDIPTKYHGNISYYAIRSILLNNVFGLDIMMEGSETAKTLLQLKAMSKLTPGKQSENMGVIPLPDLDFNIRRGNALVGCVKLSDIWDEKTGDLKNCTHDEAMEIPFSFKTQINALAEKMLHIRRLMNDSTTMYADFKLEKDKLLRLIKKSASRLDYISFARTNSVDFSEWLTTHRPFNWIVEFPDIMMDGKGFDVVIGNPPYVDYPNKSIPYSADTLATSVCGNLYAACIERGLEIGNPNGRISMIVPVSAICTKRMKPLTELLMKESSSIHYANFDDRPARLFESIQHLRACIFNASRGSGPKRTAIYSTGYNKWHTENRTTLFDNLRYTRIDEYREIIPKFSHTLELSIEKKLASTKGRLKDFLNKTGDRNVYYRASGGGNFLLVKPRQTVTFINGVEEAVKAERHLTVKSNCSQYAISALLSSSLFYLYYIAMTDCRNLTKGFIESFPCPATIGADSKLANLGKELANDYESNKTTRETSFRSTGNTVRFYEYSPRRSKHIIDRIDTQLARHYHLSEEELDHIINYGIKYRLSTDL